MASATDCSSLKASLGQVVSDEVRTVTRGRLGRVNASDGGVPMSQEFVLMSLPFDPATDWYSPNVASIAATTTPNDS